MAFARAAAARQWRDLLTRMADSLPGEGSHEYYDSETHSHFLNVRHLPELDWYLLVDKRETGALDRIRQSLYLNLAICAMITLVVLALLHAMVRRHQASTEALATLDSLTGLPNRRSFDLLAGQALVEAQRISAPLVALLIDLDHFKALNDTHGHLAGDEVLRQFANVLQGSLRQSDILCRWGGEFIVLLRETEGRQAVEVAEKIRRRTEQLIFSYADKPLRLTVSIGLAGLQRDDTLHSLLSRADHALYRAKQGGRNRVCNQLPGLPHPRLQCGLANPASATRVLVLRSVAASTRPSSKPCLPNCATRPACARSARSGRATQAAQSPAIARLRDLPRPAAMRLDRFLANLPCFNRQQVRLLLVQRRVRVDGVITADPLHEVREFSRVEVDEQLLQAGRPARYLMLHKPMGCVSATSDPQHRTVLDLLPPHGATTCTLPGAWTSTPPAC
jgi:diguanylate cyclase (GGDEF)-like protein